MDIDSRIVEQMTNWAIGIPSLGVIIAYGISIIRRRMSADAKVISEEKSYSEMLNNYKKERDELRSERERIIDRMSIIETERNSAISQVGKLTAEVEYLTKQVTELKELVEQLRNGLELARSEMQKYAIDNAKLTAQLTILADKTTKGEE